MEEHKRYLQEVCRVGGRKFTSSCKQSTRYGVEQCKEELEKVHGICVERDGPDVHPQYICVLCERALKRARRKASFCGGGCGVAVKWVPHQRINCIFCTNHTAKARGKRQVAIKPSTQLRGVAAIRKHGSQQGLADAAASTSISGMDETEEQVLKKACKAHRASMPLAPGRFIDKEAVQIFLKCNMAVDSAIQAACYEELFCASCICQWLAANNKCPACSAEIKSSLLCQPGRAVTRLIGILSIRCDFYTPSLKGCLHVVPLHQLQGHVQSCPFNPESVSQQPPIRSVRKSSTVAEVLSAPASVPQGDVATSLLTHMVTAQSEDGKLEVKTSSDRRGKPQVYRLVSECIVPSCAASSPTLKRRGSDLTKSAESICGWSDGARAQLITSLKRLSATAQEKLLE